VVVRKHAKTWLIARIKLAAVLKLKLANQQATINNLLEDLKKKGAPISAPFFVIKPTKWYLRYVFCLKLIRFENRSIQSL
jgi:hypothetical protein